MLLNKQIFVLVFGFLLFAMVGVAGADGEIIEESVLVEPVGLDHQVGTDHQVARDYQVDMQIQLDGETDYRVVNLFHEVLRSSTQISTVERISSQIIPDDPERCRTKWRITTSSLDSFEVEQDIYNRLQLLAARQNSDLNTSAQEMGSALSGESLADIGKIIPVSASQEELIFSRVRATPHVRKQWNWREVQPAIGWAGYE